MDGFLTLSFSFPFFLLSFSFFIFLFFRWPENCMYLVHVIFCVTTKLRLFTLSFLQYSPTLSKVTNCFSLHSLVDSKCIPTQKRTYRILTLYILPGRWFFCSATKQNSIKEEKEANRGTEKRWNTFSKRIFTHPGFTGRTNRQENRFCSWWSYFPAWTTGGEGCQSR